MSERIHEQLEKAMNDRNGNAIDGATDQKGKGERRKS
jgi:hypothetical protein